MKLSFRWYGADDPVTLEKIRQIPNMRSIVTAVYDVPVGEVWSYESIQRLKEQVEAAGLVFDVVESVPVHEDIKLGKPSRDTRPASGASGPPGAKSGRAWSVMKTWSIAASSRRSRS